MASPATDRLVKAEIRFLSNVQRVENVLHFRNTIDSPTPENMQALADAIVDQVTDNWLPLMNSSTTFTEVYVEEYADDISQSATASGANAPGTAGALAMPGGSTFVVSLRTQFTGRSRRGRTYTIGMEETQQNGGVVTDAYRNAWLAAFNGLRAATLTIQWELVIASLVSGGVPRSTALVTPVNACIAVDNFVDSQRRRLRGRGA